MSGCFGNVLARVAQAHTAVGRLRLLSSSALFWKENVANKFALDLSLSALSTMILTVGSVVTSPLITAHQLAFKPPDETPPH